MSGHIIHAPHRSAPLTQYGLFVAVVLGSMLMHLSRATMGAQDAFFSLTDAPIHSAYLPPEVLSCIDPAPAAEPYCDAASRRILASTVRLMFYSSGPVRISHGTVVGGRYVITHNHYTTYNPEMGDGERARATHITLMLASGEFLLRNAPLSNFTVVVDEPGLLLLDFQTVNGRGFFDYHGIPSAPVAVYNPASIRPGSEVAQVNWDGKTTFVDWGRISSVRDLGPTRALEIDNYIELGASGGGVFSDGYHIANNCLQGKVYRTHTRDLVRGYSVATTNDATALSTIASEFPAD